MDHRSSSTKPMPIAVWLLLLGGLWCGGFWRPWPSVSGEHDFAANLDGEVGSGVGGGVQSVAIEQLGWWDEANNRTLNPGSRSSQACNITKMLQDKKIVRGWECVCCNTTQNDATGMPEVRDK